MSPESSVSILNSLASLEVTHLLSPEGPPRSQRGHVWFLTIDLRRLEHTLSSQTMHTIRNPPDSPQYLVVFDALTHL